MLGIKFRAPMFVATSFELGTAYEFAERAEQRQEPPVIWTFTLNPATRCNHANFVEGKTLVQGENEFLYAPYSVFTVVSVEWADAPTWEEPHKIELAVAPDNNRPAFDNLPLAPWC